MVVTRAREGGMQSRASRYQVGPLQLCMESRGKRAATSPLWGGRVADINVPWKG